LDSFGDLLWMANLSVEEPYALMRARTGLWEPWAGNCPGPPGLISCASKRVSNRVHYEAVCGSSVILHNFFAFS
jgi:hypothetical protein